jgi:phosphate transport system permease protein
MGMDPRDTPSAEAVTDVLMTGMPELPTGPRAGQRTLHRSRLGDRVFRGTSSAFALALVGLLVLMVGVLLSGGWRAFQEFGFWGFVTGTKWNPVSGREQFGALPFLYGTVVTSLIAIILAVPVSVALALLLNEMTGWFRNPLAVLVDLLAAVPSIVFGLWGLYVMAPVFAAHVEPFLASTIGQIPVIGALFQGGGPDKDLFTARDLFTAGVILAVMILPIVTAVTREVIAVVPRDQREAAQALGATRYETIKTAVLPYARSGIVGAVMLGLGRALGETIAVALLVGGDPTIHSSLFLPGYTIPAIIANNFREASAVGLEKSALLALAVVLVGLALILAALSRIVVGRTARRMGGA